MMGERGTRPEGVRDERQAAQWVREMFGRVAPRYDLLNHLLSLNIDRYWRWRTVKVLRKDLERAGAPVVDVCCGTGDLMLAVEERARGTVFGTDFCHPMLVEAAAKAGARASRSRLFEADALRLPLKAGSFRVLTTAFGFRNLVDYEAGLREFYRVLKPGGVVAILEFSTPPNRLFRSLYDFYSRRILPRVGGAISGSGDAYTYLPDSVRRFPGAEELAEWMRRVGFENVWFKRMTAGIVALHVGRKRAQD